MIRPRRVLCVLGILCCSAVSVDARLQAAAGRVDVTPDPSLSTVWLAGYGASGRKATGVGDRLYARALLFSDGARRVAIVAVDSIGLPREDIKSWRKELGWAEGRDYLFVAATHSHSAPDTMGLWGRFPGVSGVDPGYRRRLKNQVVSLVNDLVARLRDAEVVAASKDLDPRGLCIDDRDPVAFDPELHVVQVRDKKDRKAIGTLVRWSCHPVTLTEANTKISADFPGPLCDRVEAGKGGTCVYVSGSIGGHLIPETDREAAVETQYADADRIGRRIAEQALAALKRASPVGSELRFSSAVVRVPVENSRYLLFLPSLTAGHAIYDGEGRRLSGWREWWLPLRHLVAFPLPERLRPWVETEVGVVRIGSVRVLGVPAEIFPELVVGGYDGSRRYGRPVVGGKNPNPPPLAAAPKPPYLRQRLGTKHGIVVSLANDEIGYLVPEYDFQATPSRSMLPQPKGTHYEETNSIGPRATGILLKAYDALLK